MDIRRTRREAYRSRANSSESGSRAILKVKDLDIFPPLSCPAIKDRRGKVSPGKQMRRERRDYPTTGRCTSGITPLQRLGTFSGGVRGQGTTKRDRNRDRKAETERCSIRSLHRSTGQHFAFSLTDGWFSISETER